MGKYIPDSGLREMLATRDGSHIHLCAGQPSTFADLSTVALAEQAIVGVSIFANGDVSGQKLTTLAQSGVPITQNGDGDHVAVSDGVGEIKKVTTCPVVTVTAGGTVDLSAFDHEISDPS